MLRLETDRRRRRGRKSFWRVMREALPRPTFWIINPKKGEVVVAPGRPPAAYTRDERGCLRRVPVPQKKWGLG